MSERRRFGWPPAARAPGLLSAAVCVAWAAGALADPAGPDPADRAGSPDGDAAAASRPGIALRQQNVVVRHQPSGPNPTLGPRHAPVTIDWFVDPGHQSSYRQSRVALRNLQAMSRRHPRRLRVVVWIIAKASRECLSEAALEAHAQGKFEAFMTGLLATSQAPRCASAEQGDSGEVAAVAERAGVDVAQLERARRDGRHLPVLDANNAHHAQRHIESRAAMLINGELVDRGVDVDIDRLEELYDAAYARAAELIAGGVPLARVYDTLLRRLDLARLPIAIPPARTRDGAGGRPRMGQLIAGLPAGGHELGPDAARVTIALFCTFRSRDCARTKRVVDEIRADYPGDVRLVFYHIITAQGRRRSGVRLLHMAALCADEQGAFWRYYDQLYTTYFGLGRRRSSPVTIIDSVIKHIGLDGERFDACMETPGLDRRTEGLVRAATKAGITHAPTLVVGGRIYTGPMSKASLHRLVHEELLPGLIEQWFPTW